MTRNLLAQEPGRVERHAIAAGTQTVSEATLSFQWFSPQGRAYHIIPEDGEPLTIYAKGREEWALKQLCAAGPKGCTPIDQPAPRWSAYVHKLRKRGVPIDTLHEPHGGEFSGTHGRYVLRGDVRKGGAA